MKKLLYILVCFIALTSCKEDRAEVQDDSYTEAAEEVLKSGALYNHIFRISNQTVHNIEIDEQLKIDGEVVSEDYCSDIVYHLSDDSSYVQDITITYNSFSCSEVGQRRTGKIHMFLTGLISDYGTVLTVILQDFYIEHHKIEGTHTYTNKSQGSSKWVFEQIVENGKITFPNGDYGLWESEKEVEIYFQNDFFTQTGNTNGVSSKGIEFETEILIPLEKAFTCDYIRKGSIWMSLEDYDEIIIDYGDGDCDNTATITLEDDDESESIEITLK
jgi:hypothetical protein